MSKRRYIPGLSGRSRGGVGGGVAASAAASPAWAEQPPSRVGWFFRTLLPPPRKPVRAWDAWPLIAFLVVFGIGAWAISFFDLLEYTYPEWFWLLLLTPWVWWLSEHGGSGLRGGRAIASLLVRLALIGLFIILLAEPRSVRQDDSLAVIFTVDQSQSIRKEAFLEGLTFVNRLGVNKPQGDEAGMVTYARTPAVELSPRVAWDYEGLAAATAVERDGTNIERGLALSGALLPEERVGRMVLVSDGVQTEGRLDEILDQLKARGIVVDVLPIRYDYDREVLLERLDLPRTVRAGEDYEAITIANASHDGKGQLVLTENGREIYRGDREFQRGKNQYKIPIKLRDSGYYEYKAEFVTDADNDTRRENNVAVNYLYLQGEGRVLVVTDPEGDERDHARFVQALLAAERKVDLLTSYEVSSDPMALLPYDCIVFADVPRSQFVEPQLTAIRDAVESQGSGFLMLGGPDSFGPGGWHRTVIEDILPVTMDASQKKVLPKGALVIVLHTCEFDNGNTWGKEITKLAIKALGAQDEAGVLVFDWNGGYSWLFPLTPASQYAQLVPLINAAQIGDMPDFVSTMQMGLTGLRASNASAKHMIIISDGDPQPPSVQLLDQFNKAQISISTVAVFPHNGAAGTGTLEFIARQTGGRFYFPQDPQKLPEIFIKEATTLKRSMIQEKIFTPALGPHPSDILKGIEGMPQLQGYVITTIKPRSELLLEVPDSEDVEPLLSLRRSGLGKTAAWTSDLSPRWAGAWMDWGKYDAFVKQLVIDISRVGEKSNLRMHTYVAGGEGVIVVEDYAADASFLSVTAQVEGPDGGKELIELQPTAARRYEGRFPLRGEGRYQIAAGGVGAGGGGGGGGGGEGEAKEREERTFGGLMVPYSQEFLRLEYDPITLQRIADRTGGQVLAPTAEAEDVFPQERESKSSTLPVFDWFLIALACLVPLDVALRRVQVDLTFVKGWFAPTYRSGDETTSHLLKHKQKVGRELTAADESPREDATLAAARRKQAAAETLDEPDDIIETTKSAAAPGAADEDNTTSRLLERRRRAREQMDER